MVTPLDCKNALSRSNQVVVIISRINKPPNQQPLDSLLVLSPKPNFIMVNKLQATQPIWAVRTMEVSG